MTDRWASDRKVFDRDSYLFIRIDGVPGGTDGYFRRRELVRRCRSVGHTWWFRRSAGQPAIINLAYGFVAAALGELTDGPLLERQRLG
jgi:hypothetical protein